MKYPGQGKNRDQWTFNTQQEREDESYAVHLCTAQGDHFFFETDSISALDQVPSSPRHLADRGRVW